MKRHITTMIAAAAISLIMAVPAMADWAQVSTNVWQWTENGVAVKDKWVTTQNGLYYINLDGNCSYGWINWCGNWYYGEPSGANLGNVVRNNWAKIDNSYYYFFEDGRMATGTQVIGGVTYTFDANGHCTTTPAGVNILTFSATPAVVSGGSGVYYGGGSSGGSGSSSTGGTTTETPAEKQADDIHDTMTKDENVKAMNDAVAGKATITVGSVNGTTVPVTVNATVSKSDTAAELITMATEAVANSGINTDEITKIQIKTLSAEGSNALADIEDKINAIFGTMTVEQAMNVVEGTQRTITVTMSDGAVISVNVNATITE